jgi:hypothetical protein
MRHHLYLHYMLFLAAIASALLLRYLLRRRIALGSEMQARAGLVKTKTSVDSRGLPVVREVKLKPKVQIVRQGYSPWSPITEIRVKPAPGISVDEEAMRIAISRIYHEFEWTIRPHKKGFSVFESRRHL